MKIVAVALSGFFSFFVWNLNTYTIAYNRDVCEIYRLSICCGSPSIVFSFPHFFHLQKLVWLSFLSNFLYMPAPKVLAEFSKLAEILAVFRLFWRKSTYANFGIFSLKKVLEHLLIFKKNGHQIFFYVFSKITRTDFDSQTSKIRQILFFFSPKVVFF